MSENPFTITDQFVSDTLVTALEGGINYWATGADIVGAWPDGAEYVSDVLTRGRDIRITLDPEVAEDDKPAETLTLAKFKKGVRKFCEMRGVTPKRLEDDVPDAADADCIVQLALFGKIVFG